MKRADKNAKKPEITVVNVMADGTRLTDITQYKYDPNKLPKAALQILGHMLMGTYDRTEPE